MTIAEVARAANERHMSYGTYVSTVLGYDGNTRRCIQCGQRFVPTRRGQLICSQACRDKRGAEKGARA